jgi:hypothetical protein
VVALRTTPLVGFAEVGSHVDGVDEVDVAGRPVVGVDIVGFVVGVVGFDDVGFTVIGFDDVGVAETSMDVGIVDGVCNGQVFARHRPYPPESI